MKTITCAADLEDLSFPYELQGAALRRVNLAGVDFHNANLTGADLRGANLRGANLRGADLKDADLRNAVLDGADLTGAKLPEFLVKLPPLGQGFIAWKKVRDDFVLKLEIPADSPRVSTFIGRKCRAKSAKVLEAFTISGKTAEETEFRSLHDYYFIYRVGETVEVPGFNDDIRFECTQGIHFFETRKEAEQYW